MHSGSSSTAGAIPCGRLLPESENALAFFDQWIMTHRASRLDNSGDVMLGPRLSVQL